MKEDYTQEERKSLHKVASVYEGLERIKLNKKRPACAGLLYRLSIFLYHTLIEHGVSNFHESGNISAFHVVGNSILCSKFHASRMNIFHNLV
jgi:hypothetical protein